MIAPSSARRPARGFTLVELLIVVIILGLLAAVVIPQFGNTAAASKESALSANLATMRQAIALYRIQHNEVYPGQTSGTWNEFVAQITQPTFADGSPGGPYGPYLRTGIPANPFSNSNDGAVVTTAVIAAPSGSEAYIYSTASGQIRANQSDPAPSGNTLFDL